MVKIEEMLSLIEPRLGPETRVVSARPLQPLYPSSVPLPNPVKHDLLGPLS